MNGPEPFAQFGPPGVVVSSCRVAEGNVAALHPAEAVWAVSVPRHRRAASIAGRIAAARAQSRLGHDPRPVGALPSGAPVWPSPLVGSIAHDDTLAVAACASASDYEALGVDVEPVEPLPEDLWHLVAREEELIAARGDGLALRTLFVAKEAVYKAQQTLAPVFLEFSDVAVDLGRGEATALPTGRVFQLRIATVPRIVVLAAVPARAPRTLR